MAGKSPLSRIRNALDSYASASDLLTAVDAARRLREAADELESAASGAARRSGVTWAAIGTLYGLTKQGAQQRFRPAEKVERTKPPNVAAKRRRAEATDNRRAGR